MFRVMKSIFLTLIFVSSTPSLGQWDDVASSEFSKLTSRQQGNWIQSMKSKKEAGELHADKWVTEQDFRNAAILAYYNQKTDYDTACEAYKNIQSIIGRYPYPRNLVRAVVDEINTESFSKAKLPPLSEIEDVARFAAYDGINRRTNKKLGGKPDISIAEHRDLKSSEILSALTAKPLFKLYGEFAEYLLGHPTLLSGVSFWPYDIILLFEGSAVHVYLV